LLDAARAADVTGLFADRALELIPGIPDPVAAQLVTSHQAAARHAAFLFVEAERICNAFEQRCLPSVLLKGVALARTVYTHPAGRSFRDLDILVDPPEIDRAAQCLAELGYQFVDPPELRAAHRRYHFHLAMEGSSRIRVELHWGLVRPDDPYRLWAVDLLSERFFPPGRSSFPCPHADGQVLHAVVSLLRCGFTQLKRIADLDRLVRSGTTLRWPRILRTAEQRGLARGLRLLVELTAELFDTPLDEPLRIIPPLGRARHRLDDLGIELFPLALPPSAWGPARHVVRYWLAEDRPRIVWMFLRRAQLERARLEALRVPRRIRAQALAKRTAILAYLFARQIALGFAPHRRVLECLLTSAPVPTSAPRVAGRGGTPAPIP